MAEPCTAVEPLLSAWLDGELEGAEAALVSSHLAACGSCAETLDDVTAVAAMLGNLPVRRAQAGVAPAGGAVPAGSPPALLRRAQALAVATGLLIGAALALGASEAEQRAVPAPLDAFVADHPGEVLRGQAATHVILETNP